MEELEKQPLSKDISLENSKRATMPPKESMSTQLLSTPIMGQSNSIFGTQRGKKNWEVSEKDTILDQMQPS